MEKSSGDEKNIIFTCEADVNLYNMVHLTYGKTTSMNVAFNSFVSGWNLDNDELLPYAVGTEPSYDPKFEPKVFKFDGRDKNVYIWTPDDYDKNSDDKYSVIYMFDGQSVLAKGNSSRCEKLSISSLTCLSRPTARMIISMPSSVSSGSNRIFTFFIRQILLSLFFYRGVPAQSGSYIIVSAIQAGRNRKQIAFAPSLMSPAVLSTAATAGK